MTHTRHCGAKDSSPTPSGEAGDQADPSPAAASIPSSNPASTSLQHLGERCDCCASGSCGTMPSALPRPHRGGPEGGDLRYSADKTRATDYQSADCMSSVFSIAQGLLGKVVKVSCHRSTDVSQAQNPFAGMSTSIRRPTNTRGAGGRALERRWSFSTERGPKRTTRLAGSRLSPRILAALCLWGSGLPSLPSLRTARLTTRRCSCAGWGRAIA